MPRFRRTNQEPTTPAQAVPLTPLREDATTNRASAGAPTALREAPSAYVYLRTSTIGQKESETIKAQEERCRILVQRHGVNVLQIIRDDGVSGSLLEGRAFAAFIDDLQRKKIKPDYLIVYSLSRISRLDKSSNDMQKLVQSATDNAKIKAVLLGSGCKVIDEDGINDPSSVMFDLKTTLAAEEYKLIRGRTMAGKARRLAEGKPARGGKPPYGYRAVVRNGKDRKDGWMWVPSEEAANLRKILEWFADHGPTEAARRATAANIPTPMHATDKRKNKAKDWYPTRWSPVSVQHIARNVRAYLGEKTEVFDDKPFTLKYEPIIGHDLYQRVELRKKTGTLKRRATMLSTGFVLCACGAHIHQHRSHEKHHTQCAEKCGAMPETIFSEALWNAVTRRLVLIKAAEHVENKKIDPYSEKIAVARTEVVKVNEQISRLLDSYLSGLDKEIWRKRNEELSDAKVRLTAEVERLERMRDEHARQQEAEETLEAKIDAVLREIVWKEPTLDEKRKILGDLLQGAKVRLTFGKRDEPSTLTFPPFGSLPEKSYPIGELEPERTIIARVLPELRKRARSKR